MRVPGSIEGTDKVDAATWAGLLAIQAHNRTGDYVIAMRGEDDVADGQVCRVLGPDETDVEHRYGPGEWMPVLCWTGYVMWTPPDNLVAIAVNDRQIRRLFDEGYARRGSDNL